MMRLLVVRQPYATAIALGHKPVENRAWTTRYRGLVAIQAAGAFAHPGFTNPQIRSMCHSFGVLSAPADWWPRRQIIAVVDLTDVHHAYDMAATYADRQCCGPWGEESYVDASGPTVRDVYHWVLENPRMLDEPIAHRGSLGLHGVDPALERAILERAA